MLIGNNGCFNFSMASQILKEFLAKPQSKINCLAFEKRLLADSKLLKDSLDLLFKGNRREQQLVVWPIANVAVKFPELVANYLDKLTDLFLAKGSHPAIKRNLLRVFEGALLRDQDKVKILDECFSIISQCKEPVASIAFAITVAKQIVDEYPDLLNEFQSIIERIPSEKMTPAIKVRIKRALKKK